MNHKPKLCFNIVKYPIGAKHQMQTVKSGLKKQSKFDFKTNFFQIKELMSTNS